MLFSTRRKRTGKAEQRASFKRGNGEGALLKLKSLELNLSSVDTTVQTLQYLGVDLSDGLSGHSVQGSHGDTVRVTILNLSLMDDVLLPHLSHELVDGAAVAAFLSHCW